MNKVLSMIGLAKRSGNLVSGEFAVGESIKNKKACLVIISKDASKNTKKKFRNKTSFYKIPLVEYGDRYELGKAIGKEFRMSIAITEKGFAENIHKLIEEQMSMEV